MARLEFSVEIVAPPDRVFLFFVPQRMVYWYNAEMRAEFEVQGGASEFAVGQKVRITGRIGRRAVSLTAVVTRYEWLRALEWHFHDAYGVKGMQSWEIQPFDGKPAGQDFSPAEQSVSPGDSSGASASAVCTRVTMRDEYELPGWFGHLWDALLMRHAVARRDRSSLARLKSLSERHPFER